MAHRILFAALAALGGQFAVAGAAQALTPQEVWASISEYLETSGYEVEAAVSQTSSGLQIDDVVATMPVAGTDGQTGSVAMELGSLTLTENGDGTVGVSIPSSLPLVISGTGTGDEGFTLRATIDSTGFTMTAAGQPDAIEYRYAAQEIAARVVEMESGEDAQPMPGTVHATLTGLSGQSVIERGQGWTGAQSMTADGLTYDIDITDPEEGDNVRLVWSGALSGLTGTGNVAVPQDADLTDLAAAVGAGHTASAQFEFNEGMTKMTFTDAEEAFSYRSTSQGGRFDAALGADGMTYGASTTGVALSLSGSGMPFPIETTVGEFGGKLSVPVLVTDTPQDFALGLTLSEIAVPDMIWAGFDPEGRIPHDPITIRADITGKGRLFVSLLDDEAMAQLSETGEDAGQIESLTVNELIIQGAGARISASADVIVDNEASSPFGPYPNAFGTADVNFNGVLGLVQTLGSMGLVPQGQAMMFSGMLTAFAKQGSGPDDLNARIILSPEGALSVNDQPIPLQ